jgi:hypothetical protein
MKTKILLATLLTVATVFGASAQKFKPAPKFLKGEKQINLLVDYSNVKFDGDSKEKQYKDKDQSWIKEWEGKRRKANEDSFIKDFNAEVEKINLSVGAYPKAQYTIIVDVLDCDFGSFAGPFSVPAKLKCTLKIVKTGTTEVLSSITLKESQNSFAVVGTPVDFDRMFMAFGEMGEEVGKKLYKILK